MFIANQYLSLKLVFSLRSLYWSEGTAGNKRPAVLRVVGTSSLLAAQIKLLCVSVSVCVCVWGGLRDKLGSFLSLSYPLPPSLQKA